MSTFKNKNSLRTIEAQIVQKLKNNVARPKITGSYKKRVSCYTLGFLLVVQNYKPMPPLEITHQELSFE